MTRRFRLMVLTGALAFAPAGPATAQPADAAAVSAELQAQHPAGYYQLAAKLMGGGRQDDAVFWFYVGQLRFRIHLACHPDLDPSGNPALFAALSESVGRPINEYAFGDIPALAATLDQVLAWDDATPNGFTSKTDCATAVAATREGLAKLRAGAIAQADDIRHQRTANGLPNR